MNLNNLNLNKLFVFTQVAHSRSLSAAAANLSLTVSAISQAVSSLEASLGLKLIERGARGSLLLTKEGELLARESAKNFLGISHTLEKAKAGDNPQDLTIRLGLFVGFSSSQVAPALSQFLNAHEGVQVKTFSASLRELDRGLEEGKLDIVLSLKSSKYGSKHRSRRVMREELLLVTNRPPPKRRLAYEEILSAPFVDYYEHDPIIHRWIQHHFRTRTRKVKIRAFAATAELVLELIRSGLGAGVVPRSVAEPYLKKKELFAVLGKRTQLAQEVWVKRSVSTPCPNSLLLDFENRLATALQANLI